MTMRSLITYGSQYGSTRQYAESFASLSGFPILPYSEVKAVSDYDRIIHFGALYAGGVLSLKRIVSLLSGQTNLIIVTIGLADVQDAENINNIRRSIRSQVSADVLSGKSRICASDIPLFE